MDVSPNDKLMVTGSQDKTAKVAHHLVFETSWDCVHVMCVVVQLWNTSDGGLVGVLRGHRRGIWCVQFSPVDQVQLHHTSQFLHSLIR